LRLTHAQTKNKGPYKQTKPLVAVLGNLRISLFLQAKGKLYRWGPLPFVVCRVRYFEQRRGFIRERFPGIDVLGERLSGELAALYYVRCNVYPAGNEPPIEMDAMDRDGTIVCSCSKSRIGTERFHP